MKQDPRDIANRLRQLARQGMTSSLAAPTALRQIAQEAESLDLLGASVPSVQSAAMRAHAQSSALGYRETTPSPDQWFTPAVIPRIAPGTDSAPIRLDFSGLTPWGEIVCWKASAASFDPGAVSADQSIQASAGIRLSFNGRVDLISTGEGPTFSNLNTLFSPSGPPAPMYRFVTSNDILEITFRNYQPAGGATLDCFVSFGVRVGAGQKPPQPHA